SYVDQAVVLESAQETAQIAGVQREAPPELQDPGPRGPDLEEQPRGTEAPSGAEERLLHDADPLAPGPVEAPQDAGVRRRGARRHSLTIVRQQWRGEDSCCPSPGSPRQVGGEDGPFQQPT